jgi:hypothetical protein
MSALSDTTQRIGRIVGDMTASAIGELRTNPRARTGLAAMLLIIVLAIGLRGWSYVEAREAEIAALRASEKDLASLTSETQARAWAAADLSSKALLGAARGRLWSSGPVGSTHADFLGWVQQAASAAGLEGAQVRLGQARKIGANGQLTELSVTVFVPSMPTPPTREAVFAFLKLLDDSPRRIDARSLRITFDPVMVFEGGFAAYAATGLPDEGKGVVR